MSPELRAQNAITRCNELYDDCKADFVESCQFLIKLLLSEKTAWQIMWQLMLTTDTQVVQDKIKGMIPEDKSHRLQYYIAHYTDCIERIPTKMNAELKKAIRAVKCVGYSVPDDSLLETSITLDKLSWSEVVLMCFSLAAMDAVLARDNDDLRSRMLHCMHQEQLAPVLAKCTIHFEEATASWSSMLASLDMLLQWYIPEYNPSADEIEGEIHDVKREP
jgi:hypothetical protein